MKKSSVITAQNVENSIATENDADYICLTDMVKGQLTRLNAIDAEKGFRNLETKNVEN